MQQIPTGGKPFASIAAVPVCGCVACCGGGKDVSLFRMIQRRKEHWFNHSVDDRLLRFCITNRSRQHSGCQMDEERSLRLGEIEDEPE